MDRPLLLPQCPVFALVKHLAHLVVAGIKVYGGLSHQRAFAGRHVVAIDARRRGEAAERIECFGVFFSSTETVCRSDAREFHFANEFAIAIIHFDLRPGVFDAGEAGIRTGYRRV